MKITKSLGMLLLAIYLILFGLGTFGVDLGDQIMMVLALVAGVLILLDR